MKLAYGVYKIGFAIKKPTQGGQCWTSFLVMDQSLNWSKQVYLFLF